MLNAAALVLNCSSYDYYVFQDVDTVPVAVHGLPYTFPKGPAPLHLTPFGIHPHANFEVMHRTKVDVDAKNIGKSTADFATFI